MLLCLYRHPVATPDEARLGLVRSDDIVDVHLACLASLAGHMKIRRAHEIAQALAPADLLGFLEGGRHAWNALADSLDRLGGSLGPELLAPEGEVVVIPKQDARLVPVVPAAAGWSSEALGTWETTPVPSPGSSTIVALHTDGRAYLPEYFAVVGATADHVPVEDALDAVSLVTVVRPSRPETAALLHRLPDVPRDEIDLEVTVAAAVAAASAQRPLYAGDIVRCGPAMVTRSFDLRERAAAPAPAGDIADIVPLR